MKYIVFKEESKEVLAIIEGNKLITKKGYSVTTDEEVGVLADEFEGNYSVNHCIAKFEPVSENQFNTDFTEALSNIEGYTMPLWEDIKLPKRATKGSAGYDFFAPFDFVLEPNETIKFPTGIRCKIQDGYVLELYPRSSLGFKYKMKLDNTVGIIDSDYYDSDNEGHIHAKFTNTGDKTIHIKKGEAYMQGIFKRYYLAEEEEVTEVRNGGIGSTNK